MRRSAAAATAAPWSPSSGSGSDDDPWADEATRLLAIGAHLDRGFTERAVSEYLRVPTRALAPSVGVDPPAVLRECLVARRRRIWRDRTLSVVMLLFAATSFYLLVPWLLVAVGWRAVGPSGRRIDGHVPQPGSRAGSLQARALSVVVVVAVGLSMSALAVSGVLGVALVPDSVGLQLTALSAVPCLLSLAALAVLAVDRWVVWTATTTRMRRGRFSAAADHGPSAPASGLSGLLHDPGSGPLVRTLRGLAEAGSRPTNCVVSRGDRTFVGSGHPEQPWSVSIALEPRAPRPGEDPGVALRPTVGGLHHCVLRDLAQLVTGSTSLSPSARLAGLRSEGRLVVPAAALLRYRGAAEMGEVLSSANGRPATVVSDDLLRFVEESPREWMRYFACHVVESWDREVAVSLFVHFGLDERNLYVEIVPCLLRPITGRYRTPDTMSATSMMPALLDAVGSWTVLPLTIVGRALNAWRPAPRQPDESDPARFGAAASLRELAQDCAYADYLQSSDVHRYLQLLQSRTVRAIGSYLDACRLSQVDFTRQTEAMTVNYVFTADVRDSVIGGAAGGAAPAPAASTTRPAARA